MASKTYLAATTIRSKLEDMENQRSLKLARGKDVRFVLLMYDRLQIVKLQLQL